MKAIETITALEIQRGKTYKVRTHMVPSDIVPIERDEVDYYVFSVDFAAESDGKVLISTNDCKFFSLPASQYVYRLEAI